MLQYIHRKIGARQSANTILERPLKVAQKKITDRAQLTGQPASSVAALITNNPNTLAQYTKYLRERRVAITNGSPEALARAVFAEMQKEYLQQAINVIQSNPELHSENEVNNPSEVAKQIAFTTYDMDASEYDHCQKNNMLDFTNCLSPASIVAADLIGQTQPDNYDCDCGCGGNCNEKKKPFDSFDTSDPSGNIGGYPPVDPNATKGNPPISAGTGGTLLKEWNGYQIYSDGSVRKNGAEVNLWDEFSMSQLCAIGDVVKIDEKLGSKAKYYHIACGAASAWDWTKDHLGNVIQWILGNTTNEDKNFDNSEGFKQQNIDVNRLGELEREWRKMATGSVSGSNYMQNPLDYFPINAAIYGADVVNGKFKIDADFYLLGNVAQAEAEIFRVLKIQNKDFWTIPAWMKYKAFAIVPRVAEIMYGEAYSDVRSQIQKMFPSWNSNYADTNFTIESQPSNNAKISQIFKPNYSEKVINKAKEVTGTGVLNSLPAANDKPCEGAILWVGGQENGNATGFFTDFAGIGGNLAADDLVDITVFAGSKKYEGRHKVKYIGDDSGGNKWNMFTLPIKTDRTGGTTVATQGKFVKVLSSQDGTGQDGTGQGTTVKDISGKVGFIYSLIRFFGWDKKGLFN